LTGGSAVRYKVRIFRLEDWRGLSYCAQGNDLRKGQRRR
jgi:hypothetical protein